MTDNKQINRDWTLREDRTPRRKDVVIDSNDVFGVVVKTEGSFGERLLTIENINGDEIYTGEPSDKFRIANRDQTSSFFLEYKTNKGWIRDRIYTVRDRDYPLQLIDLKYDLVKQDMLYVFRDLTSRVVKHVKTQDENLVQPLKDELYSVSSDETLDLVERIRKIENDLKQTDYVSPTIIAINIQDNTLYVASLDHYAGQPAIFNSKNAAAVALQQIGESNWISILQPK